MVRHDISRDERKYAHISRDRRLLHYICNYALTITYFKGGMVVRRHCVKVLVSMSSKVYLCYHGVLFVARRKEGRIGLLCEAFPPCQAPPHCLEGREREEVHGVMLPQKTSLPLQRRWPPLVILPLRS